MCNVSGGECNLEQIGTLFVTSYQDKREDRESRISRAYIHTYMSPFGMKNIVLVVTVCFYIVIIQRCNYLGACEYV